MPNALRVSFLHCSRYRGRTGLIIDHEGYESVPVDAPHCVLLINPRDKPGLRARELRSRLTCERGDVGKRDWRTCCRSLTRSEARDGG